MSQDPIVEAPAAAEKTEPTHMPLQVAVDKAFRTLLDKIKLTDKVRGCSHCYGRGFIGRTIVNDRRGKAYHTGTLLCRCAKSYLTRTDFAEELRKYEIDPHSVPTAGAQVMSYEDIADRVIRAGIVYGAPV